MSSKHKLRPETHSSSVRTAKELDSADKKKAQRVLAIAFLLLVLLRFIAAFFPKQRLWGLNHLAYVPMWLTVLLTAVALFSCTELGARVTRSLTTRLYQFYSWLTGRLSRTLLYILLSLGFALLCWSFPIQFPFLGDGPMFLLTVARIIVGDKTATYLYLVEPLTGLTYLGVSKFLPATTDITVASAYVHLIYRIAGAMLGGTFFFLVLTFAHQVARQVSAKVIIIVTLLGCAGTLFFFGYIEYYTFVYVGIGFYCYTAVAYFHGRVRVYAPVIVFLLSVGFHFLAVVLLPSLVYLLLSHWSGRVRQLTFRQAFVFAGISAVFLFVVYLLIEPIQGMRGFFIPLLRDGEQTYSLLSHYRLADLLNEQLLLSQIGIVFLGAAMLVLRKQIEWNQQSYVFLLFASAYMVMLNLSGQTLFGMGIDWDIFAAVGLVYTLLGIYLVLPVLQKSPWQWSVASMVVGSVGMSFVPWIVINVNSDMAVERFKNMMVLDVAHLREGMMEYRYETVRKYYQDQKREPQEFEAIQTLIAYTHGKPRQYDRLLAFIPGKNPTKYREPFLRAFDSLSRAVEESKRSFTARTDAIVLGDKLQLLIDVYARFLVFGAATYRLETRIQGEQFKTSFPQLPEGYEILGWHYFLKEDYNAALEDFQQSHAIDSLRLNTLMGLGKTFYEIARLTEGREMQTYYASHSLYFFEKVLAIQPRPWILIDGDVGYLYLFFGQNEKARKYFQEYLRSDNTSQYAQGIKRELSKLR